MTEIHLLQPLDLQSMNDDVGEFNAVRRDVAVPRQLYTAHDQVTTGLVEVMIAGHALHNAIHL